MVDRGSGERRLSSVLGTEGTLAQKSVCVAQKSVRMEGMAQAVCPVGLGLEEGSDTGPGAAEEGRSFQEQWQPWPQRQHRRRPLEIVCPVREGLFTVTFQPQT